LQQTRQGLRIDKNGEISMKEKILMKENALLLTIIDLKEL
jgi:hypothetical protein